MLGSEMPPRAFEETADNRDQKDKANPHRERTEHLTSVFTGIANHIPWACSHAGQLKSG